MAAATPNPGLHSIQYAPISINSQGDNVIINGATVLDTVVPIVVISYKILVGGVVTLTWYSDVQATGTALSGAMAFGTTIFGDSASENRFGWFETVPGESLNIYLSAGVPVTGFITYSLGYPG